MSMALPWQSDCTKTLIKFQFIPRSSQKVGVLFLLFEGTPLSGIVATCQLVHRNPALKVFGFLPWPCFLSYKTPQGNGASFVPYDFI